jgi:hypothetical protein
MATGVTISTTGSGATALTTGQKILIGAAGLAFEPAAPDPDLVRMENLPEGHRVYNSGIFARLAQASAVAEADDLSRVEQLVPTYITIEPSEHGILVTLSKRARRRQGDADAARVAGEQMGGSLRRRQANDTIVIYDTFTKSIVGAGSALDITYFRGSVAYLMTDNDTAYGPAPMPLHAALHIEQISDIILDLTDTSSAGALRPTGPYSDMIKGWWRGNDRLYGISIFHSGNIARDTLDDSKGTIKHKNSIVMVEEGEAEVTDQVDNSARLTEFGLFKSWGEALQIDPHGVEIHSDTLAVV